MARKFHPLSLSILKHLAEANSPVVFDSLKLETAKQLSNKEFYNYLFRLEQQELVKKSSRTVAITPDGEKLLKRLQPGKDGVWKLIIFDIPEKHKYVRTVLRAKLKQLHFKKWQNSIWISPYEMDKEIEDELADLGKKFFVRLIKTTQINHSDDLQKMFPD